MIHVSTRFAHHTLRPAPRLLAVWLAVRLAAGLALSGVVAAGGSAAAREMSAAGVAADLAAVGVAAPVTEPAIAARDLKAHVEALAGEEMAGRLSGAPGGRAATAYVATLFERIGLEPAGDEGSFFHHFAFPGPITLAEGNRLGWRAAGPGGDGAELALDRDWRPLGFSLSAPVAPREVVFVGYGVNAPRNGALAAYDSFAAAPAAGEEAGEAAGEPASLAGRWALIWRGGPPEATDGRRRQLLRVAGMRYKASVAKARGAAGVLLAAGPGAGYAGELPRLELDAASGSLGLPVVALGRAAAERLLRAGGVDPATAAAALADGDAPQPPTLLQGVSLGGEIALERQRRLGRNVIGRLRLSDGAGDGRSGRSDDGARPPVVIGAHVDHLGRGGDASSLARPAEAGMIHYGADDNASGVAALLEIAEAQAAARDQGRSAGAVRDILFAAWSAEELGLIGSTRYVAALKEAARAETLEGVVSAYLNMDMVGRLRDRLELAGLGSSPVWTAEIERAGAGLGLAILTTEDVYLPTDATAFYLAGAPILSATTGSHDEYHTPRDRHELINYDGLAAVSELMSRLLTSQATAVAAPVYVALNPSEPRRVRRENRLYLGTIPDYVQNSDEPGVRLSGVTPDGPAGRAGLRGGDLILSLDGEALSDLYDLVRVLNGLAPGEPVALEAARGDQVLRLTVTPQLRD